MSTPPPELEGTVEDIQKRLADFAGQRLHVTVHPLGTANGNSETVHPQLRPIGLCKGQFVVPDSFFDPLLPDLQKAFEGDE
jgi:hypothetical protein